VSDTPSTIELLADYKRIYAERKTTSGRQRLQLTAELTDLEAKIVTALRTQPVPEPLGMDKLREIAHKLTDLKCDFLAVRLTTQHFRHPTAIPFNDLAHVREYLGNHLDDEKLAQIPELNPRKKILGLF